MTFGIICLSTGVVFVLLSGWRSAQRVKRAHGDVNSVSVRMSEGTGVVPGWLSFIGLMGYAAIAVGALILIASALT